jgi:hypothetical protein
MHLKIRLPDQINAGTALQAYKEVIVQYDTIAEAGPKEMGRIDLQNFLLDVESIVSKTLTSNQELRLFHLRHSLEVGRQRTDFESVKVKLGRAFDRYELYPVGMYFSESKTPNPLTIGFIRRTVAAHYHIPSILLLEGRCRKEIEARRVAIYISRLLTGYSLHHIAASFGRDTESVRRAIRFVDTGHSKIGDVARYILDGLKGSTRLKDEL